MNLRTHLSKQGTFFIAGRNDETNEELISQAKPDEYVFHTEKAGSPFVNIKGIPKSGDLKEAAIMCARYSREWKKRPLNVVVHYFLGKDISKSKLMKLGTFGVKKAKTIKVTKEEINSFICVPIKKKRLLEFLNHLENTQQL